MTNDSTANPDGAAGAQERADEYVQQAAASLGHLLRLLATGRLTLTLEEANSVLSELEDVIAQASELAARAQESVGKKTPWRFTRKW